jgi:hypothetical protein
MAAAGGCSVADLMSLFISVMILATQFVVPAQAATKAPAQNSTSTSGHLPKVERSSFFKALCVWDFELGIPGGTLISILC